ncbi:host cell division inhibitor Icd-like protein [Kosakonia sacchari]|uniref:Host cell division inhibitor Icd-like protein n=1 Tax=Kosakonia sacchari TaxID=1158459 RepID=A0ABZ0MPB6_9ENTR|nr:host cell division inhibitor Icd-like protein [Kosakonia sacchari]WOZ76605.1 host cell division inhibitor Icd-like protein [Kosakonia sacchari]
MNNTINSVINFLRRFYLTGYSSAVAAKSATGRRNLSNLTATQHAPCVFFYVAALAHLYFLVWCLLTNLCHQHHIIKIMVVRAGQPSGWPVFVRAGIPTPVRATTHERRNSGGGVNRYLTEIAIMATVPALLHPEYTFLFLAVRRTDGKALPAPVRITAPNERDARLQLITEFVLCFAGRIPSRTSGEVRA